MDLEHSGEIDTESNERKVESGRKVLGMVFSRAFQLVLNNGNSSSDNILSGHQGRHLILLTCLLLDKVYLNFL